MKYLTSILLSAILATGYAAPMKGIVVSDSGLLWQAGIIPYLFDETLTEEQKERVELAIQLWTSHTFVQFLPIISENISQYPDYVLFTEAPGKTCASSVGRQGGRQLVRLSERCELMTIAHELGHLIGLWHEQGRLDRDLYVEVLWDNIREGHEHNFEIRFNEGQSSGPYDYDSIMHYSAYTFSKNDKPTLRVLRGKQYIGQRTHLSVGDIQAVNLLYQNETR